MATLAQSAKLTRHGFNKATLEIDGEEFPYYVAGVDVKAASGDVTILAVEVLIDGPVEITAPVDKVPG